MVGLAGGIGSGKTMVAQMMSELGGGVISSDQLGHLEIDTPEVVRAITGWWGSGVLTEEGGIDRRKVASIVFGDPSQRHRLEALLHPRIAIRRADMMEAFDKQPRIKFIVIDTPLLYEADLDLMCDAVVFVDADSKARCDRSEKHRNWPEGEWARREKNQQALDMKRARADYICKNNSTLTDLRTQVESIVSQILTEFAAA